jgi:hypothetical protein
MIRMAIQVVFLGDAGEQLGVHEIAGIDCVPPAWGCRWLKPSR